MSDANESPSLIRRIALLAITILVIAALYFGRELLIPITLATFLALLLAPVVRWAERLRIGRIAAVVLVMLASLGVIGAMGWLVAIEASALAAELPHHRHTIVNKISGLRETVVSRIRGATQVAEEIRKEIDEPAKSPTSLPVEHEVHDGIDRVEVIVGREPASSTQPAAAATAEIEEPVKVKVVDAPSENVLAMVEWLLAPVVHPLATFSVAIIFAAFFLVHREDLRDRLLRLSGQARIQMTTATLTDAGVRVARYFAAQALANTIIGVAIGTGLYFFGVPKAALWGLMAAVLRFIPYLGALIAALFPAVLSAALSDGWTQPFLVVAWTVLADQLSANVLEPWLFSARVGASPTAILLSFMFWTWLWGGIGLLLAMPITVCLVVLGKHVPAFEFFYILLGNESVLEPELRFYQRLLAMDRRESIEVVKGFAETSTSLEVSDRVVLPALARLEYDRNAGLIEADRIESARNTVSELMEWLAAQQPGAGEAGSVGTAEVPAPACLVLPDRGAFDDFAAEMLIQAASTNGCPWKIIPAATLSAEIAAQVDEAKPAGVVITAIEPRNLDRILHIHKRLGIAETTSPIYVGLFSRSERGERHRRRLQRLANVSVSDSLASLAAAITRDTGSASATSRPAAA